MTTHYTVFIGRFQPFHRGHLHVVRLALARSDKLIMVIGGFEKSRSHDNPFTANERVDIIKAALANDGIERVMFAFVHDTEYNNLPWIADVQSAVDKAIASEGWTANPIKISLIGHSKDSTSFYLKMFPSWDSIPVDNLEGLSATDFRKFLYDGYIDPTFPGAAAWEPWLVNGVQKTELHTLMRTSPLQELVAEHAWLKDYRKQWWPRDRDGKQLVGVFNTVDAVVTLGGHILLIQRGGFPGRGQWALPGGFLNPNERAQAGMIRELREETKLTVPEPALVGAIDGYLLADIVGRDPRGRVISHCFHINMNTYGGGSDPTKIKLPKIKGSDDAKKAQWFTFEQFRSMRDQIFADHYGIAMDLITRAKLYQ